MHQGTQELLVTLQQLEEGLRRLGWWQSRPPPLEHLESEVPFCADRLEFHQWLQWIFIPRVRQLLEADAELPRPCHITPAAEVAWRKDSAARRQLLPLLQRIDDQLNQRPE